MSPETAPFHRNLAEGPTSGTAYWVRTADDVRLRIAVWPEGAQGTVLLFPGRTEYAEKYGRAAAELGARGFATATIDWRGQGLSDRALPDLLTGHVQSFGDYQADVAAMAALAGTLGLPRPWMLLAHSMGGAIGLRALHRGLAVQAAAFSAPMWGIAMPTALRPVAWSLSWAGRQFGFGHRYAPGTGARSYLDLSPFEENVLTSDPEMYAYMIRQTEAAPKLALGGPSLHWLIEALVETRALRGLAPPALPALCMMGTDERVVDGEAVRAMMRRWPLGHLRLVDGARHEVMMELPAIRQRFFDEAAALFDRATAEPAPAF